MTDAGTPRQTEVAEVVDPSLLDLLIDQHRSKTLPRLCRLWDYYRNELTEQGHATSGDRDYRLPQERGLPPRYRDGHSNAVRRLSPGVPGAEGTSRWQFVIENDIAWRIHSLVDFMFGKPLLIQSHAEDPELAAGIEHLINRVLAANGGISFFQNLALLGSVYSYVDVLLRVTTGGANTIEKPDNTAVNFHLDAIEAPRAVPLLNAADYRQLDGYVLHYRQQLNRVEPNSLLTRVRSKMFGGGVASRRASVEVTQVWTDRMFQCFTYAGDSSRERTRHLVEQSINRLGVIPVVHIQNLPQPFFYEGLSEVEPLIPLQDELNTRLSDRANRVTFQSFKMYLGKGIEHFLDRPVGPGQMWQTANPDASIQEFGGDANSPSEEAHITEIRDALDKTSGVTPVAAGLLRNRVGNLTSESALRVTLMGLLARTEKKRVTYGVGIERICEMILHAADVYGILATKPSERAVRIVWPSPLPENLSEQLRQAKAKLDIGVSRKQVLAELGYAECVDAG